jgi:hypothetical protein
MGLFDDGDTFFVSGGSGEIVDTVFGFQGWSVVWLVPSTLVDIRSPFAVIHAFMLIMAETPSSQCIRCTEVPCCISEFRS